MGHNVTIGGERLGSGNKMKTYLPGFERSTHDLSYVWRSTMSAGTLVPFMNKIALPGDTWDIELDCDVLTQPTIGPLFGSYKIQLDVFQIPIRLYNAKLHGNWTKIGMDMSAIKLPQVRLTGVRLSPDKAPDNQQINPSCIFNYLGIKGIGYSTFSNPATNNRDFLAVPWLAYWDIYKQYYANKQEEIGAVIHKPAEPDTPEFTECTIATPSLGLSINVAVTPPDVWEYITLDEDSTIVITGTNITEYTDPAEILIHLDAGEAGGGWYPITDIWTTFEIQPELGLITGNGMTGLFIQPGVPTIAFGLIKPSETIEFDPNTQPQIVTFPLENIDNMREKILTHFEATALTLSRTSDPALEAPYSLPLEWYASGDTDDPYYASIQFNQEGLGLKTYNSDLFNNWLATEWIDGENGIAAITAVDTSGGSFTIDELNMSKKVYDMLNRIAISGGTADDWQEAIWDIERTRGIENPMYLGGLIQNLVFQEVISNAATESEPLGSLAGRGRVGNKRIGGQVTAKISEPSIIMGIISLTPNIDYSQGNDWSVNLKTMNDLHKPPLDAIGFQDLITDQMAWWDTNTTSNTSTPANPVYKSAGKQPAWINYMTAINEVHGNFADQLQQMFMVLNRRYSPEVELVDPGIYSYTIRDLTTYIDPTLFNHIFADTRRDAQNFWVQIGCDITARRKMSAKVIPNL